MKILNTSYTHTHHLNVLDAGDLNTYLTVAQRFSVYQVKTRKNNFNSLFYQRLSHF
jgi:hypothetical protein